MYGFREQIEITPDIARDWHPKTPEHEHFRNASNRLVMEALKEAKHPLYGYIPYRVVPFDSRKHQLYSKKVVKCRILSGVILRRGRLEKESSKKCLFSHQRVQSKTYRNDVDLIF